MTTESFVNAQVLSPKGDFHVEEEKYTHDDQLKLKLRDINLIKHNPNLFTNRNGAFDLLGGWKTTAIIFGTAILLSFYSKKANSIAGIRYREGWWNRNLHFLLGGALGTAYSFLYFVKWQVLINDYFAQFLLKRFKDAKNVNRSNIWKLRNEENKDDCYNFTNSYFNTYHI